jgi:hypothetical protein
MPCDIPGIEFARVAGSAVGAIVAHLELPTEAPPIARARDAAELGFGLA